MGIVGTLGRNIASSGRGAYNALFGPGSIRGAYNAFRQPVGRIARAGGKAMPVVGPALTAFGAYSAYNSATESGTDPGKAAFEGIGGILGGTLGGIGGTFVGGPVGSVAGGVGGNMLGSQLAGKLYDFVGGGDKPVNYSLSPQEQEAIRQKIRTKRQQQQIATDGLNIAGFGYSPGVDPALVGMRMQQQAQNINTVQGYSTAKHLSNNSLRATLGQQGVDRYGIGQMGQTDRLRIMQNNITERYGIGRQADVANNRIRGDVTLGLGQQYTDRYGMSRQAEVANNRIRGDVTLGLGQQYTQRYAVGRQADNDRYGMMRKSDNDRYSLETARQMGNRNLDLQQYDLREGYGLKERERKDKRYMYDVDAGLRGKQLDNNFAIGGLNIFSNLYR